MALTPEEQRELDELEYQKLLWEKQQATAPQREPRQTPEASKKGMLARLASMGNPYGTEAMMRDPSGGVGGTEGGMLADMGLEGGGATLGHAAGAATGPFAPIAMPAFGAVGGAAGNALAQGRRMYITGEQDGFRPGEMLGAGVAGSVPGASLANAGLKKVAVEAGKQAIGNTVGAATQTGIDEGRLPSLGEAALAAGAAAVGTGAARSVDTGSNPLTQLEAHRRAVDATRRQTLAAGRELGYVLPPAAISDGPVDSALNTVGGKLATAHEAVARNQPITNAAVRAELGLDPNTPLSREALAVKKAELGKVYDEVAAVSQDAGILTEWHKKSQRDANAKFSEYRNMQHKDPTVLEAARVKQDEADEVFGLLTDELDGNGKKALAAKLKEARTTYAKVGVVEEALNPGSGDISAEVLGAMLQNQERKLTGNLEKVAKFQLAFERYTRELASTPPPGGYQLGYFLTAGAGIGGYHAMGPAGIAMAAAPMMAPWPARQAALSQAYQSTLRPNYGATQQDFGAMLARYSTQAAGRPAPENIPEYLRRR
jgi:hypothetical protein